MIASGIAVAAASAPAGFVLAERGKAADCAIVVPADAPEPVRYAAEELRDFTEKTTGVRLPIVSSATGKAVALGAGDCPQIVNVHKSPLPTNAKCPQLSTNENINSASSRLCVEDSFSAE